MVNRIKPEVLRSLEACWTPPLKDVSTEHWLQLHESAISDDVIVERGYRSVQNENTIAKRGFSETQCRPGLLIPSRDIDGGTRHILRPDYPRTINGKTTKYEFPAGGRPWIDIPERSRSMLRNPAHDLWITEGVKKTDALVSKGLCAIGLFGVYGWRGTNDDDGSTALPDWESIALKNRRIYIVFDSDLTQNHQVETAALRLRKFLERKGAHVKLIYLRPGANGQKVGVDDYFYQGGTVKELLTFSSKPHDAWPEPADAACILASPPKRPDELIERIAFVGAKIYFAGSSKSYKTWVQMHFAVCITTGKRWFGCRVKKGKVLYINLELGEWSFQQRLRNICDTMGVQLEPGMLKVWHLRGQRVTIEELQTRFATFAHRDYALIIVDPLYKLEGDRSENSANEMADLFWRLEQIAHSMGAAIFIAHHFAKGDASGKNAIDRASGTGVIGRDGDVIITMTEHQTEGCMVLEYILRDFAPVEPQVLRWEHPIFKIAKGEDPERLKSKHGGKPDVTDAQILEIVTSDPQPAKVVFEKLRALSGRGIKHVESVLRKAEHDGLIQVQERPRPRTNPEKFYYVE